MGTILENVALLFLLFVVVCMPTYFVALCGWHTSARKKEIVT